jgi:hypothetical protein
MGNTVDILKTVPKERNTNTWEQCYIYRFKREELTISKQYTDQNYILLNFVLRAHTYWWGGDSKIC